MPDKLKAVIDLGSNSVRLVIYQQGPHGTEQEVDNLKQTVRLSSHLDADYNISEQGIQVTINVLLQFKHLCEARGVTEIIGVATQAVRMAANQDEVIGRIHDATGILFQVLPGKEEARYGYLAVVNSLPLNEAVTVDIGGGSTEITYFRERKLVHHVSIPYGAVSLTKILVQNDPLPTKELKALETAIDHKLDQFAWLKELRCPVVGLGGTARSVAKIHQREHHYPLPLLHGYAMWPMEVTSILDMVRSISVEKRTEVSGLSADRADIIVAGTAILDRILKRVEATQFLISNKGLRDGVLIEQVLQAVSQDVLPDILMYSTLNIQDHFRLHREHAEHVWKLSEELYSGLVGQGCLEDNPEARRCLLVAAMLHDLGRSVNIYNVRNHTFYLMLNVPLFGLSHREQVIAAGIAAFKTQKQITGLLMNYQELLHDEDINIIAQMGTILGLAQTLDRTETSAVESAEVIEASSPGAPLLIRLYAKRPVDLELNLAVEWIKRWKKVFLRQIRMEVEQVAHSENL